MTVAEQILSIFGGRVDQVAVADDGSTFRPVGISQPLRSEWLEKDHLGGKRCYGFYVLTADNKCRSSCVDFDNKPHSPDEQWQGKTEAVYYFLANAGLAPLVEVSASGNGSHVWLFFDPPADAWAVRAFWKSVGHKLDIAFREIFPKQDVLTGKGFGNLVRYPLWNQSRFVDVESEGWPTIDPAAAMSCVKPLQQPELSMMAFELGFGTLKPETTIETTTDGALPRRVADRIANQYTLLARRWQGDMTGMQDPSRSALAMSICCELVRTFVPTPEVEVALRYWCKINGYEKGERDDWITRTVAKAYDLMVDRVERGSSGDTTTIDKACHEFLDIVEQGAPASVPSGIGELDDSIDGVGFGEMCVIAARPSHGKSAFALQWLDTASAKRIPCLIISEEMSRLQIAQRAMLSISEMGEFKWKEIASMLRREVNEHYAERAPVYIVENCHTIDRCEEVIDQFCAVHGVRLVAVDYLQLLGGRGGTRYEDVTEISRRLKQAAGRNKCAMLALCQMNREVEKRNDFQPKLSDLRESGQIEQDADMVLMLQWPMKMKHDANPNEYRIFCAKRRNGAIRQPIVQTCFNPERQQFGRGAMRIVQGAYEEFAEYAQ